MYKIVFADVIFSLYFCAGFNTENSGFIMYNYEELLALIDRSSRFQEMLEDRIGRINGNLVPKEELHPVIASLFEHLRKHHQLPIVSETDCDGVIINVNEEFCRKTKFTKEELIGQNIRIIKSGHIPSNVFQSLWSRISRGGVWMGELKNRAKDFETFWVDIFIAPVLDESGNPIRYWSVAYDVTDQMKQKEENEAKSKDIMESIRYAKRIQKTILPDKNAMDKALENHFTLFKPKDIVSGDFYWFTSTVNKVFVAVVDCTGHGVPGAFMSLIGYNLLNQIVNQQNIHTPAKILNELHIQVRSTLKQDSTESKSRDGMDVCLCAIERYGEDVEFAGAFRPLLWWHENELVEIKGDKFSIGGEQMEEERVFTNHFFEVSQGDIIYMFSDGMTDQFGGPDIKKFSTRRLKDLIVENHHESMHVQRALFNIVWKDWKAEEEQTDDVTMIGIAF